MIRFIRDIHRDASAARRPVFSIEFFPPKTDDGTRNLFEKTLPSLQAAPLDYCSVTYGAGGSTREKTIGIVDRIQREWNRTAMMHLTCVNATRDQLTDVIEEARSRNIKNILALRGDPPGGSGPFVKTDGGFEFSSQLVALLRSYNAFSIGTAGFPEGHIACAAGKFVDWSHLRDKIQAGADFVVTQLFFDNTDYFVFRDFLTKNLGVHVPLIPGILPVLSRTQTRKFTELCGAKLSASFLAQLDALGDDDEAVTRFGIDYAARQIDELLRQGAPGIHFYSLNKARSTVAILQSLGFMPHNP